MGVLQFFWTARDHLRRQSLRAGSEFLVEMQSAGNPNADWKWFRVENATNFRQFGVFAILL
jgi:hypothetical protein